MGENLEVVQRTYPVCRPYVLKSGCRSCALLHHVRGQGNTHTYCGVACTSMDGWLSFGDMHPEDVAAVDRCLTCYVVIGE